MPSVSTRISMTWEDDDPFEDTQTIVIVGNEYYVDVRIKKDVDELDWAMAGIKEWLSVDGSSSKARFTPILNSRPHSTHDIPDEGEFTTLPNGDQQEIGYMYDKKDGRVKRYCEIWRDFEIPSQEGEAKAIILKMTHKATAGVTKDSIHAKSDNIKEAWIAKIGNWQVAIAQFHDNSFGAWQATRDGNDNGDSKSSKSWKIVKQFNGQNMASIVPIPDGLGEGLQKLKTVTLEGITWNVMESFEVWITNGDYSGRAAKTVCPTSASSCECNPIPQCFLSNLTTISEVK